MELNHYLRVIRRRWWVVVAVAVASVVFTIWFVSGQAPEYESTGTYVVRPIVIESGEQVRATDALNRGVEINSTYTRIARSDVIKNRAKDELRAEGVATSGLGIRAEVVPGTNIIEIGATGDDPEAVARYAMAVGEQTIGYLEETGEAFQLQLLDAPDVPQNPVPTKDNLTIVLGAILGLTAGAVIVFSLEYLGETEENDELTIFDEATGAYSDGFLKLRIRQEMSRCELPSTTRARWRVRSHSFTVGVVKLSQDGSMNGDSPDPGPAELRDAAQSLMPHLRVEDVVGYVGEATFVVMLPDMPLASAEKLLDRWGETVSSSERNGARGPKLRVSTGVCQCDSDGFEGDAETVRYAQSLRTDAS